MIKISRRGLQVIEIKKEDINQRLFYDNKICDVKAVYIEENYVY